MAETLNTPSALSQPIAQSGDKNTIPVTNDQSLGLMSQSTGFPPICSNRIADGGKAPRRADFNGAFNLLSQQHYFFQNGGTETFRQEVSDAIGGYPLNARLWYTDNDGNYTLLRSTIANNTNNFNNGNFNGWKQEIPVLGFSNTWTGPNTFSSSVSLNGTISGSKSVKETITGWGMPDYSAGVSIASGSYIQKNGYVVWYQTVINQNYSISINGSVIFDGDAQYNNKHTGIFPVSKGDVVTYTNTQSVTFYPCKGV